MENKKINVLLFGATGLAGSGVLHECIKHPQIAKVTVVVRKSTGVVNPKITELIHSDFMDFTALDQKMAGLQACFYCLGVSQLQAPEEEKYRKITRDFTLAAVKSLIKVSPGITFCFLSGAGTDATMKSKMMWARVKGETEAALSKIPEIKAYHFRPGYIHPKGEVKVRNMYSRIFSPLYPILNLIFPSMVITTQEFGQGMINAALYGYEKQTLENMDIRNLAKK